GVQETEPRALGFHLRSFGAERSSTEDSPGAGSWERPARWRAGAAGENRSVFVDCCARDAQTTGSTRPSGSESSDRGRCLRPGGCPAPALGGRTGLGARHPPDHAEGARPKAVDAGAGRDEQVQGRRRGRVVPAERRRHRPGPGPAAPRRPGRRPAWGVPRRGADGRALPQAAALGRPDHVRRAEERPGRARHRSARGQRHPRRHRRRARWRARGPWRSVLGVLVAGISAGAVTLPAVDRTPWSWQGALALTVGATLFGYVGLGVDARACSLAGIAAGLIAGATHPSALPFVVLWWCAFGLAAAGILRPLALPRDLAPR